MYWFIIFEAEFLSFCYCTELAKRISRGEVNGNPCPRTPKCLFCKSTGACWGNMKNLHRHTLLRASFQAPRSAFKTSSSDWNRRGIDSLCSIMERGEELFCKVTTSLSKLRISLMSTWRQRTVIAMGPGGVCLFESGSLMSSLLQLCLLSAPVSVAAYWDFSSNCSWKWDLALQTGFEITLTCCKPYTNFSDPQQELGVVDRGLLWAQTCLWPHSKS